MFEVALEILSCNLRKIGRRIACRLQSFENISGSLAARPALSYVYCTTLMVDLLLLEPVSQKRLS